MDLRMQRFLMIGLMLCCCGCGRSDGLQRAAVGGKVTLDGVDVSEGTIAFYPSGGSKGPAVGGIIQDGQYAIAEEKGPAIGHARVEIHASKKTGRKMQMPMAGPGVMIDEIIEIIPKRYNTQSVLVAELDCGQNVFDCELTSK
jgi:hypothetical protein